MVITIAFIIGFARSTIVIVSAVQHGRTVGRAYRVSIALGVFGVLLVLPALLVGTYGLPASWTYQWLGTCSFTQARSSVYNRRPLGHGNNHTLQWTGPASGVLVD